MLLSEIAAGTAGVRVKGNSDPEITGTVSDSRRVKAGFLFAAIPGVAADGGRYVDDALARGAAAVLAGEDFCRDLSVAVLRASEPRKAYAEAANVFYGNPSSKLRLLGVTGTNGKTSTAYMLRHILGSAGIKTGMLGTIEYDLGGEVLPSPLTTPDAADFASALAAMAANGCQAAVAEVSSHALTQYRVWPHRFAGAVFTNLTRDHLDYHGSMEAYLQAKKILFDNLEPAAFAVVNLDDPAAAAIIADCTARSVGYTLAGTPAPGLAATARLAIKKADLSGQTFAIAGDGIEGDVGVSMIGVHNVQNFAGAILTAVEMGVAFPRILSSCADFPGVPGRLERIDAPNGAAVFVDYSHTDGALISVLSLLRPLTPGRVITVFGCGGDRDRGKRPLMAKAAESVSDLVIVTSDNPRTEDPQQIFADIMPGFANPGAVSVVPDRPAAVAMAVRQAVRGDAVLVAGKGHEDYQILGTRKIHMDDRELVRKAFC